MALITGDEVQEQLGRWGSGGANAADLERWAREVRREREAESEAVNEVLGQMQVLARIRVKAEDIRVLSEALSSRNAAALLQVHFGAARKARPAEGAAAAAAEAEKARLVKKARRVLARATNQRNVLYAFSAGALVVGLPLAFWVDWRYGSPGDHDWGEVALTGTFVVAVVLFYLYQWVAGKPKCPFCREAWDVMSDDQLEALFDEHACPHCGERL